MKKIRKIASLLLAMVMVLAMSVTALAATVEVDNAVVGETYSIYKIFDAVYSSDESSVTYTITSDSDWYNAVSNATSVFDLTAISTAVVGEETITTYQVELVNNVSDSAVIAVFTAVDTTDFSTAASSITPTTDNPDVKWDGLGAGYYFVTSSLGSLVSVDTAGTATIKDKNDVNDDLTKTVKDAEGNVITSASIGDELTYTITSSVPLVWSNQTMTEYSFVDTLPSGLTYNDNVSVIITGYDENGNEVTKDATSYASYSGGVLTVTYNPQNIDNYPVTEATITITYTAMLNENAETAETNKVTSSLNSNGVEVTVYTYGFNLQKVKMVNGELTKEELSGAEFTLKNSDENVIGFIKTVDSTTGDVTYTVSTDTTDDNYTTTITVGSALIFGLEAGTYTLTETVAPTGYNLLDDPITVIVGADGSYSTSTGINTSDTVIGNSAGTELPGTGGIGTTIFYVLGSIMVLGAAVVLITRRRMGKAE